MNIKLLTENHLEFLSLKGGCIGSSESTLVKMPHCWKSHVAAHIVFGNRHYLRWSYLSALLLMKCLMDFNQTYTYTSLGQLKLMVRFLSILT